MTAEAEFLRFSSAKLAQMYGRLEECCRRLTPEQIWARTGESQNAVGNLLLHLTGNLRQWILAGVGGAEILRDRDAEFAARGGIAPEEMLRALRQAVNAAVKVIEALPPERLTERVWIQGHHVTLLEAIYHVVEHFSGHLGQIIYVTKACTNQELGFYSYLSVPGAASGRKP
jgi:uncharacterized damage-inducible protein DinB